MCCLTAGLRNYTAEAVIAAASVNASSGAAQQPLAMHFVEVALVSVGLGGAAFIILLVGVGIGTKCPPRPVATAVRWVQSVAIPIFE